MKKQSFLQGAGILALATIAVKIIGAIYKIPLNNILGKEGYGTFSQAYVIYSWLLVISTAGLPVAMSRMIAKAQSENNSAQIHRIFTAALNVFLLLGLAGCVCMILLNHQLAALLGDSNAALSILALGPAVLFVCLNSAFRGYFQGQSNMTPTGISQIIEAGCKLVVGIALAQIFLNASGDVSKATAGAILGVTSGSVLAFFYLAAQYRKKSSELLRRNYSKPTHTLRATMKELLAIAIPITLGSAGLETISVIDSSMVMHRLTGAAGFVEQAARGLRGIYGSAQTLFNLPGALVLPFSISIIPAITACLTRRDRRGALRVENSAIRIMTLLILPCGVGLGVLSKPIMTLLYHSYTADDLTTGGVLLSILSVAVIFNGLVLLLNAIMQAHGFVTLPVVNMIVGGIVKVVINFILVGIPSINIYGAPIGTTICFLVITMLDVFCIKRVIRHPPRILHLMAKPLIASAFMGVSAYLVNRLAAAALSPKIACVLAILVAAAVYGIMALALGIVTYQDCMLLPKGEKIAKLLKIR
ncbi:MAG: polysaccharide biosynthesis protein [Oscillospiraceae bacterium]|nr:polysaccharide biosynthesis protein [Oscillospiraceae bacterium]